MVALEKKKRIDSTVKKKLFTQSSSLGNRVRMDAGDYINPAARRSLANLACVKALCVKGIVGFAESS